MTAQRTRQSILGSQFPSRKRRGISTLWLILFLPLLICVLCFVVEVGNLWLARIELESAMESAALAAVKEWGDSNGGDTDLPRERGILFAGSNSVRQMAVTIDKNYLAANINDNADCEPNPFPVNTADLVFGAVDLNDPNNVIFDATTEPSCGAGAVMFDATGQGNLSADDAWGFAYRASDIPAVNANQIITTIVINVDPGNTGAARFVQGTSAVLSTNSGPAVRDTSGNSQPDNLGFNDLASQVTFSPIVFGANQTTLTITFSANGGDTGFNPSDRFRFGASVEKRQGNGPNYSQASGDDIGQLNTQVSITFEQPAGTPIGTFVGNYFDNATNPIDGSNACPNNALPFVTDVNGVDHLVVHGRGVLDLPCPATSAASNNGQSFGELEASGTSVFGVRAQTNKAVPSVCKNLFGFPIPDFSVSAKSTAMYDCTDRDPKLIRIDTFTCP